MLNKVILSGRITRDIEVKQSQNGNAVTQFTLAVERSFSGQNGERQTDFISCVAWGRTAEFVGKYFAKGRSIAVIGQLRSRSFDDKNGVRHYVTEVYVDEAQFTFEPKQQTVPQNSPSGQNQGGGYVRQSGDYDPMYDGYAQY